jgi:hypothetical protein
VELTHEGRVRPGTRCPWPLGEPLPTGSSPRCSGRTTSSSGGS